MTPEDLVEIEQIRQLKARYFHLMDQKRWDEWEQVFCEDARIFSFGPVIGTTEKLRHLLGRRNGLIDHFHRTRSILLH